MSRCTPKSKEFIEDIRKAIESYNTRNNYSFPKIRDICVYYDAGECCTKRDYVANFRVTRPTYSCWSNNLVKDYMRQAGATNIIGGFRSRTGDLVEFAFDIKKSKLKEVMTDDKT